MFFLSVLLKELPDSQQITIFLNGLSCLLDKISSYAFSIFVFVFLLTPCRLCKTRSTEAVPTPATFAMFFIDTCFQFLTIYFHKS